MLLRIIRILDSASSPEHHFRDDQERRICLEESQLMYSVQVRKQSFPNLALWHFVTMQRVREMLEGMSKNHHLYLIEKLPVIES